jgi:hypothetical protein
MPRGPIMIQLQVNQFVDGSVIDVDGIRAEAFECLTEGKTTVREISVEKAGGILVNHGQAISAISNTGYARLRLVFNHASKEDVVLLAPSHVPSPEITGASLALLELRDFGMSTEAPANIAASRILGAHVYLDETA